MESRSCRSPYCPRSDVHAQHLAGVVKQWATRISRTDGRIRLDELLDEFTTPRSTLSSDSATNPEGGGLRKVERSVDGEADLPMGCRLVPQLERRGSSDLDFHHSEICQWFSTNHSPPALGLGRELDYYWVGQTLDHMVLRDEAAFAVEHPC